MHDFQIPFSFADDILLEKNNPDDHKQQLLFLEKKKTKQAAAAILQVLTFIKQLENLDVSSTNHTTRMFLFYCYTS